MVWVERQATTGFFRLNGAGSGYETQKRFGETVDKGLGFMYIGHVGEGESNRLQSNTHQLTTVHRSVTLDSVINRETFNVW